MPRLFSAPLTGPKVFAIFAMFFLTIITVNMFMAYSAVSTFPGLEVKNSYVASQSFDDDRAAQVALGWQVTAGHEDGRLIVEIRDAEGRPVVPATITGIFGRPTMARDDQTPAFLFDGTRHVAPMAVAAGGWVLRLEAEADDGTTFRQRMNIEVR